MAVLRTSDGKLILVGGRFLSAVPGTPPMLSLTLSDFQVGNTLAKPVIQRKAGFDYGDVPVLFTYTGGAPANIQARVVDADTSAVILTWTSLTSTQVNDATHTGLGVLSGVPIGCEYLLQIRDGSQPSLVSNGARRWGVGVNVALVGQSNMLRTLMAGNYNDTVPGSTKSEYDYWLDPAFSGVYFGVDGFVVPQNLPGGAGSSTVCAGYDAASGGASRFLRIVGAALKAKYGRKIPVCASVWAFNGMSLERLTPPSGDYSQIFTNSGTAAGSIGYKSPKNFTPGDFEIVLPHQGEAANGQARVARVAALKAFYQAMLAVVLPFGRTASDLAFLPAVLGVYTQADHIEDIRAATYDFVQTTAPANGWPRVRAGWNCIDLDTVDGTTGSDIGLHFNDVPSGNQYRKWSVSRMIQSALKELGCATFGGMGPRISGATRSGLVATVTITHEGGTTLVARNSGAPLTGWYGHTRLDFDDTLGAPIAVTAAISGAGTAAVTFPAGTVFPAYLKYMGGKVGTMQSQHPDVTNPVYDNAQYPTGATGSDVFIGLPLQPTPDAIQVT